MTAGLVGVAVAVLVGGTRRRPAGDILAAVGAGVGGAVGLAGLYRGMAVGAMGVVAPISALAAVVPFAVGVAQGERPGGLQIAGVVAALAGVALVSREPSEARSPAARAAGVGLALAAAAGFGLYFVLMDAAADESATWAVLVARATASVLGIATVALLRAAAPRPTVARADGAGDRVPRRRAQTCSSASRPHAGCSASSRCSRRSTRS